MPIIDPASTSASALIESLREQAGDLPNRDSLNGAITDTATAVTFTSGEHVAPKSLIEIDLEVMRVTAKASTTAGTVVRAQEGSTAVSHATGAEVIASFRHSRFAYLRAINRALDAISTAFGRKAWDEASSFGTTTSIHKVPDAATHVFAVRAKPSGYTALEDVPFRFHPSLPTSISSTGKGVELTSFGSSGTVYVGYEVPWTNLAMLTDRLDDSFPDDAIDLIELGAKWYLADAESFERVAFTKPHARIHGALSSSSEIRLEAQSGAGDFLSRRSDLAARERHDVMSWMRG